MVTHRSITIRMPACFYSDDNGPITKIQVIVAESGGKAPRKKTKNKINLDIRHFWLNTLGRRSCLCSKPGVESRFTARQPCAELTPTKTGLNVSRNLTQRPPTPPPLLHLYPCLSPVKDVQNLTNWKNAFFERPAPYLTDQGFPNPPCPPSESGQRASGSAVGTYVIGENNDCAKENNTDHFCNGPLKSCTVYV